MPRSAVSVSAERSVHHHLAREHARAALRFGKGASTIRMVVQ
jgi:hypothetical protein